MSNRHLSRSIVLQTLFELDFEGAQTGEIFPIFERTVSEFAPGTNDRPFMNNLLKLVLEKKENLDILIEKAAPDWPIDKISAVDRNILRIGLAELLFADRKEVPPKVAINEAIELAKQFGSETSGRFVNGVLGAVYKELGEPGKEETTKPKKKYGNVPLDKLPVEKLAGAVVYAKHEGDMYLALVHDVFGHWTLSKGKIGKNVSYFLCEASFTELTLENKGEKGGLDDVRWFKLADILDLNFYDDILPIVTKAITMLAEGKGKIRK